MKAQLRNRRAAIAETDAFTSGERATVSHAGAFRLLFFCLVCVGMGQSMLFSILPPAARVIGLSPFQVSTIFATSASIWVFISPMGTSLYELRQTVPFMLNGAIMAVVLVYVFASPRLRGVRA